MYAVTSVQPAELAKVNVEQNLATDERSRSEMRPISQFVLEDPACVQYYISKCITQYRG